MKKIFVAVLAMAGVVACNTVDTLDVPQNPEIRFANAFVENATRANEALDPSTTTESLTAFDVWGFMDKVDGTVFVGEDVTGSKGNFSYANVQYWAPGHTYYFAAVAPMNSENVTVNTKSADLTGIGTIAFKNVDGTEDLLYSAVSVAAPASITAAPEAVKFTFSHLLSKVKFTFKNGFANDNAYIDVKNVTMTAPQTATATLTGNWWEANPWAGHAGELILAFGDACAKTPAGKTQVAADERLTIPAGADKKYTVTFDVALYMGDVVAYEAKDKTATIEGVALEIGKAYNFSATLNASNLTKEGEELYPIVFDVEEVKNWVENVPVDEVIDTDEELAAVLSNDSFPYSQINVKLGANLTYNVGAREVGAMGSVGTEVITIDLNGHTLTFNQTNSDWNNINTNGAKLVIKNGKITNTGHNNGPWNRHDLNFVCPVELVNVVSDKAIALAKDATLTKVTINDANTSDTYAVWVRPMGQTVVLDECTIDMLNCSDGRGLKIDNQYLSAAEEAKVTLKVSNTVFKTEEKSAILVKTTKGADITLNNVNIAEVAADNVCPVWIDEAVKDYADLVTVTGGNVVIEGQKLAVVASNDAFVAAVAAGCDVISLADGTYNLPTSLNGMNLYITGASKKNTIIDMSNGATPQYHAESVSFKNLTLKRKAHDYGGLSHTGAEYIDNCIIEGTLVTYAPVVVVKNSSFVPADTEFYNLHIYSAGTSTFENCTFKTKSCRSVYAYAESAKEMNISFKDCTFATDKQLDTTSSKYHQAIRLHTELGIYGTLSIENCSTDGKFNPAYNNGLWVEWNNSTKVLTDNFVKTIK